MSTSPMPRRYSRAEYLALEEQAERRSEFYQGELFAMAGASIAHVDIVANLSFELTAQLRESPCRVRTNDQRLWINEVDLSTYPDIVIVCEPDQVDAADPQGIVNPKVIIEVLSPSTESYDRGAKFRFYKLLPLLQEVVLVSQDRMQLERFVRQPDQSWSETVFDDPAGTFTLASLAVSVPLSSIYRNILFPAKHTPDRPDASRLG